jgi:hypothetical protein
VGLTGEERCDCHPNLFLLFSPFRQKTILHFSIRPLMLLFIFVIFLVFVLLLPDLLAVRARL